MHSNRLRVEQANADLTNTRLQDLRAYLDRLIDTLDDSSLRAVLTLMICETRDAVCKQQQLIALERLDGREAGGRMPRLRELEAAQRQLTAVYASQAESEDEGLDDEGLDGDAPPASLVEEPALGARTAMATMATASGVQALSRLGTIRKKPGDYAERLSAAALKGELARAEPAPVRDRQGRHGAGPAR